MMDVWCAHGGYGFTSSLRFGLGVFLSQHVIREECRPKCRSQGQPTAGSSLSSDRKKSFRELINRIWIRSDATLVTTSCA
jgi:hypothetical protein